MDRHILSIRKRTIQGYNNRILVYTETRLPVLILGNLHIHAMSIDAYSEEGNKLIQEYIREFDKLYFEQKRNDVGQRFVEVGGMEFTIQEFLKYKLETL